MLPSTPATASSPLNTFPTFFCCLALARAGCSRILLVRSSRSAVRSPPSHSSWVKPSPRYSNLFRRLKYVKLSAVRNVILVSAPHQRPQQWREPSSSTHNPPTEAPAARR